MTALQANSISGRSDLLLVLQHGFQLVISISISPQTQPRPYNWLQFHLRTPPPRHLIYMQSVSWLPLRWVNSIYSITESWSQVRVLPVAIGIRVQLLT